MSTYATSAHPKMVLHPRTAASIRRSNIAQPTTVQGGPVNTSGTPVSPTARARLTASGTSAAPTPSAYLGRGTGSGVAPSAATSPTPGNWQFRQPQIVKTPGFERSPATGAVTAAGSGPPPSPSKRTGVPSTTFPALSGLNASSPASSAASSAGQADSQYGIGGTLPGDNTAVTQTSVSSNPASPSGATVAVSGSLNVTWRNVAVAVAIGLVGYLIVREVVK